jgi:RHH-type proline utilization regulon transcriptional repressor/proline dehydrogenase/delta 1-pyrroline-5-carboxylate dehydrogenase
MSVPELDSSAALGGSADVVVESEGETVARLARGDVERVRALVPLTLAERTAAHRAGLAVIDAPVLASGRLELRWYLREQTLSRVVHRYGTVIEPAVT